MFGDLDWPLNASRGLSATAEFLVCTFQYWINLQKYVGNFRDLCVCCIDQRLFGRKHSLVAHRHQNNLSIQSTWHSVTGSGQRVKKRPGRVWLGHGSKVQARFHLWVGNMLLNCTYVAHALRRWLLAYQCKKGNCGLHLHVMISGNVHIYAWLREAYVSAEIIVCVCTVWAA